MELETPSPAHTPCLCNALRQASRAVSRLYDDELRTAGLRTTQFALLSLLSRSGEVRQGDLGELILLEETSIARNLRPLLNRGWVAIRPGADRREKWVAITAGGIAKLDEARPAWTRAQERMKSLLPAIVLRDLLAVLPHVAQTARKV
jgi:DNA-binding MarR family transcriptional regulator